MSWKADGNGGWTWVEDGSGDPSNPPQTVTRPLGGTGLGTGLRDQVTSGTPTPPKSVQEQNLDATNALTPEQLAAYQQGGTQSSADADAASKKAAADKLKVNLGVGEPTSTGYQDYTAQQLANIAAGRSPDDNGTGTTAGTPPAGGAGAHTLTDISGNKRTADWEIRDGKYVNVTTGETAATFADLPVGALIYNNQDGTFGSKPDASWRTWKPESSLATTNIIGVPVVAAAAQNSSALVDRISTQTDRDIAGLAAAGGAAKGVIADAATLAGNTGNRIYNDTGASASDAISRGDSAAADAQAKYNALVASGMSVKDALDAIANNAAAGAAANANIAGGELNQTGTQLDKSSDLVKQLQDIANGPAGPSAAEAQLKNAQDRTLAQSIALARSGRGAGGSAQALRSAIFTNAAQEQQGNNDLAALRAQEAATARGQNITALTGAAGASTQTASVTADLAKTFAGLGLDYNKLRSDAAAQGADALAKFDATAANVYATGQGTQVEQGKTAVAYTGQGADALTKLTNTSVEAQKAAALLGTQTATQIALLSQAQLSELQNIVQTHNAEELQAWAASQNIALQIDVNNSQQTAAILGAVGTLVAGAALLSDVRAKTDVKDDTSFKDYLASLHPDYQSSEDAATGAGADQWLKENGLSPVGHVAGDTGDNSAGGLSVKDKLALLQMAGTLGSQLGRGIASDERGKKALRSEHVDELLQGLRDILEEKAPEPDSTFEDFLASRRGNVDVRAARGYSYRYKDPRAPGAAPGRHYGPMAQDMLRTSAADAVGKGPGGKLFVDPGRTAMETIAGLSEQQRRLDTIEDVLQTLMAIVGKEKD